MLQSLEDDGRHYQPVGAFTTASSIFPERDLLHCLCPVVSQRMLMLACLCMQKHSLPECVPSHIHALAGSCSQPNLGGEA